LTCSETEPVKNQRHQDAVGLGASGAAGGVGDGNAGGGGSRSAGGGGVADAGGGDAISAGGGGDGNASGGGTAAAGGGSCGGGTSIGDGGGCRGVTGTGDGGGQAVSGEGKVGFCGGAVVGVGVGRAAVAGCARAGPGRTGWHSSAAAHGVPVAELGLDLAERWRTVRKARTTPTTARRARRARKILVALPT
ncbi:hypothetical protein SETIT_J002500v2, partial [Setaria italica]